MSSHILNFDPFRIYIIDRVSSLIHLAIISKHTNSIHFFDFNTAQKTLTETRKIILSQPIIDSIYTNKEILVLQEQSISIYQLSGHIKTVEISFVPHSIYMNYISSQSGQIFLYDKNFNFTQIAKLSLPPIQILRNENFLLTISLLQAQKFEILQNENLKELTNIRVTAQAATSHNGKIIFAQNEKIYEFDNEIREVRSGKSNLNCLFGNCSGEVTGKCWNGEIELGNGYGSVVSCCEGVDVQIFGFSSWEICIWM